LARWEAQSSLNLVRSSCKPAFGVVLYSKRLDALAQAATADAVCIELREAPQKEAERLRLHEEAARVQQEGYASKQKELYTMTQQAATSSSTISGWENEGGASFIPDVDVAGTPTQLDGCLRQSRRRENKMRDRGKSTPPAKAIVVASCCTVLAAVLWKIAAAHFQRTL